MPIKKKEEVSSKVEESIFQATSKEEQNDAPVEFEVELFDDNNEVKEETKKEEPSFSLSAVQKMMKDAEERMMSMFNSQISKLKLNKDKEELDADLDYVQSLQDDWLENPVVFFAFSYQFSIHGDMRRGVETIPPQGAIRFKPVIRTKRKRGKETQVISVSSVVVHSKEVVDYLRTHTQYGILFFENVESAMNVDATWAQKMVEAQTSISRLSDIQVISRAQQEGIAVSQSPEDMRRQLVEKMAKRSIEQHERMLYGSIQKSIVDKGTGRSIIEKTIA
jgi:hypothetical protein